MRKKYTAIFLSLALTITCLAGCGKSNTSSTSSSEAQASATQTPSTDNSQNQQPVQDDATYGQITKISGNKVTLKLLKRDQNGMPGGPNGQGQMPQSSGKPAKPQSSGAPNGKNGDNALHGFTATGKTKTVTLSDSVKLQKSTMDGTVTTIAKSDLSKGTIVQLTMDDSENITALTMQEMGGRMNKGDQQPPAAN